MQAMRETARGRTRARHAAGFLAVGIGLALTWVPLRTAQAQQPGEIGYHDDPSMPEGVVGERIRSLIHTFNSGDPERVRRFIEQEATPAFRDFAPMEDHQAIFAEVLRRWGPVAFHGIRTYEPPRREETIVILKDGNFGAWRAFTLRLDAAMDFKVAGFRFGDARSPTDVVEPALTEGEFARELKAGVERACERDVFSGTVLVARGEEISFTHACGEASKRFHVANNLETKFNLGSMNKMFTATAIMQLVERGVLSLDDPISRHVDESWLPRETTDRITIHHLLTHTSGLGSYFNDTYWNSSRELYRALDDYKPLVQGDEPAFEPGSRFRYSNTGMFLLGVVIESATGHDYFDYIRENIYEAAGMMSSDSYEMDAPVENLAIGYEPDPHAPGGYHNNLYKHVIKGGPAGGGFSTVGDLHRYALAMLSGTLVSEASRERMWTDHFGEGYGYGFAIEEGRNGKLVGHGGGFAGISANLDIMLDRGFIVAVMSNYGGGATPVANRILDLISRLPSAES